jgi:hypothetical protein
MSLRSKEAARKKAEVHAPKHEPEKKPEHKPEPEHYHHETKKHDGGKK